MSLKNGSIFFFILVGAVLTGCSGSGRNLGGGGRYCNIHSFTNFETPAPGAEVISNYSKSENKGTAEEVITSANLPAGTYETTIADFMYLRKENPEKPRRWIMTQIRQEVDGAAMEKHKRETGEDSQTLYKSYRYCAGGYRAGDASYDASMNGITKMTVTEGGKVEFDTTSWGYRFDGEKDKLESLWMETDKDGEEKAAWSKPDDATKYSAPKDVYGNQLNILSLRKLPTPPPGTHEHYQIYARQDLDEKTYQLLLVTLKRTPPAAATSTVDADTKDPSTEDVSEKIGPQ